MKPLSRDRIIALVLTGMVIFIAEHSLSQESDRDQDREACTAANIDSHAKIQACTRVLEREVGDSARRWAIALRNRGLAWKGTGDLDHAVSDFTEALSVDPSFVVAYEDRGNIYRDRAQCDEAIADYTQATEFKPDYADAYYNRGLAYDELEQYDKAVAD